MQDISTESSFRQPGTGPLVERCLPLNELTPGMVLSQPLITASGGHLEDALPAGSTLNHTMLDKLRHGHGLFACVWEADARTPHDRAQARAQAHQRLDAIFEGADLSDPLLASLKQILLDHRALR